jgi:fibronectin-binding autotransporter adhesin
LLSGDGANPNFVKAGTGTMRLTNTGNTANFSINQGALRVDDMAALGSGSITLNTGTLQYGGGNATTTKNLTLGNVLLTNTFQVLTPGANLTYAGTITEAGPGTNLTVYGPGPGQGPSMLSMVGNQSYSGITAVARNGVLATSTINNSLQPSPIGTYVGVFIGDTYSRGTLLLTGANSSYSTDRTAYVAGYYSSGAGGAIGVQNALRT